MIYVMLAYFDNFNIFGGLQLNQSNIYDGAFVAKIVNREIY